MNEARPAASGPGLGVGSDLGVGGVISVWETKSLGEIIQLEYGKPLDPSHRSPNGLYPAYGANGEKDRTNKFYRDTPSLIIGRKGSAGEITLTEEKYWPLDVTYFAEFDRQSYDLKFLYYLLSRLDLPSLAKGVKPGINRNEVYALPASVPLLPEQRRIVAILDESFEGIATAKANAERNLRNAREVFEGFLRHVFSEKGDGWTASRVGVIADCCLGKMLDKVKNKGEPKPYLRNLNVRWFGFDLSDLQEMRFTSDEYERYSVRRGDVVICEGGYPGRAAIWEHEESIFIQKALHRVRFPDAFLGRWFLYYLYSQEVSGALRQHFTGTGIQHFTGAALSRLSLPLAPKAVTVALVNRFDALAREISRLEENYRSKLAALDELKKSLLHQAFSGQL